MVAPLSNLPSTNLWSTGNHESQLILVPKPKTFSKMREFFIQRKPWAEPIWPGDTKQRKWRCSGWTGECVFSPLPNKSVFLPLHSRALLSSPPTLKGSRKHNVKITVKSNSFSLPIKTETQETKMSCSKAMQYLAQVLVPFFEKLADFFWKGTDGKYFQLRGHAVPTTAAPKT